MAYKNIKSTGTKNWLTKDQSFKIRNSQVKAANKAKDRKLKNETLKQQTSLIDTLGGLANKRKELKNQKYSRKMEYKTAKLNYKQSRNKIAMLRTALSGAAQNIGSLGVSGAAISYAKNQPGSAVDNANKLVGGGNTDTINNTTDKRQEDTYGDYRE